MSRSPRPRRSVVTLLSTLAVAAGCSSDGGDGAANAGAGTGGAGGVGGAGGAPDSHDCVPSEAAYADSVQPILEARCGQCHGATPDWGAPFSLMQYPPLVEGGAVRIVDRMVKQVSEGTMPPAGQPRLTTEEFEAVLDWASCGQADAPYNEGLLASQPIFAAPSQPPPGLERIDLTADNNPVPAGTTDEYQRFRFQNVVDQEVFVRRFDVKLDQSQVVHHITLRYTDGNAYLYAWAPGTGAVQFPDGGLRVRPSDGFSVEIHYNNYSATEDFVDSSGISLFVGPPEGTEYGMSDPCTFQIAIPPNSKGTATVDYTALADLRILAGMPHMHEIGSEFLHELHHADGTTETLISLTNWSFESQFFYSLPAEMKAGESMTITCGYENPHDTMVTAGLGTADEMCYNFMYITPPGALPRCSIAGN